MAKLDKIFEDVSGRCAAVRTLSAARVMTRHFDEALRSTGLTITRNLKPLETAGYVVRGEEGPARKRKITLTPAGQDILKTAYPLWQKAQKEVEGSFPGDGYAGAKATLKALRAVSPG